MLTIALLAMFALPAQAEPADGPASGPARELWLEGKQLWDAGDYAKAVDRFDRAYEIEHTPSLGLWVARTLARAGRLVAASDRYRELALQSLPSDASSRDWSAKREAESERQQLVPRIPSVVVQLDGAVREEVLVTVNGQPLPANAIGLPRLVDPGSVRVRGSRGENTVEASAEVAEGEVKTVRLAFVVPRVAAAPARSPEQRRKEAEASQGTPQVAPRNVGDGRRVIGYVSMGIGGAAMLTGAVFGLLAVDDESRLQGECPSLRCPGELSSDVEAYESRKTVATVGLLAGAALATTGLVLYLTAPRAELGARVGVYWRGSALGLQGAF